VTLVRARYRVPGSLELNAPVDDFDIAFPNRE
jgi:hypothetical protein